MFCHLSPNQPWLLEIVSPRRGKGGFQEWHSVCALPMHMETFVEAAFRIMYILTLSLTLGTLLVIGFVRVCFYAGLLTEQETGSTVKEFLKSFS